MHAEVWPSIYMTFFDGNVLKYTFFAYFIGLPNRNSLTKIEIHMRAPKSARKIWQYKHQLGSCKNGAAPDTTLEKLSEIFLRGLHQYSYNEYKLKIPKPDEFDDVDFLISQILKYQQIKNATLTAVQLQTGETCYLSLFSNLGKHQKKIIVSIKDQVNVNIPDE